MTKRKPLVRLLMVANSQASLALVARMGKQTSSSLMLLDPLRYLAKRPLCNRVQLFCWYVLRLNARKKQYG